VRGPAGLAAAPPCDRDGRARTSRWRGVGREPRDGWRVVMTPATFVSVRLRRTAPSTVRKGAPHSGAPPTAARRAPESARRTGAVDLRLRIAPESAQRTGAGDLRLRIAPESARRTGAGDLRLRFAPESARRTGAGDLRLRIAPESARLVLFSPATPGQFSPAVKPYFTRVASPDLASKGAMDRW
jgi:hypothetical protein